MNYIRHLTGFFEKVVMDRSLNPTHVSLYIALFQCWNYNRFKNPISINRDEVMRISKISSKATYHKCLHNLHNNGYIKYEPSYNPFRGSHVIMLNFADDLKPPPKSERQASSNFDTVNEQVVKQSRSGSGTTSERVTEQALVPSINNTNITNDQNITNSSNVLEPEKEIEGSEQDLNVVLKQKEKSCVKKEKEKSQTFIDYTAEQTTGSQQKASAEKEIHFVTSVAVGKPSHEEVLNYFDQNDFPAIEANKFFNYFNSIGWLVGGKAKMVDWHSAAQNWMLNAPKYQPEDLSNRATNLNSSTDKDYSEPL